MGVFSQSWAVCFLNALSSAGSSVLWIYSSLLLQKCSTPSMPGRVLATDYALALLAESFSAYLAGMLRDDVWPISRASESILGLASYYYSYLMGDLSLSRKRCCCILGTIN
jgi:hypothetical protein